jgi:ketosteroid isomerase-like protein
VEIRESEPLLVRAGFVLFTLALLTGFAMPAFLNQRMALAVHLTAVLNALILMALGLAWGLLAFSPLQKTRCPAMLLSALVLLSACAPRVNDPADVQALKATMEAYTKGIVGKDAQASVAMMTDKTAYYEPHMPAMTGKDAVAKFHQLIFDNFDIEMVLAVADVQVEGNLATMRGTFTNKFTPKVEGVAAMPETGNWTVAARRQADGAWKWESIMGASDKPIPGTTADGAVEKAMAQVEWDWVNAMPKRDVATIERLAGKEWTVNFDGQVTSRAQFLADVKDGVNRVESYTLRDISAHAFGDAGIATMTGLFKGTYKGKDSSGSFRGTDFFIKRDGRWQIVNTQNVSIKP